MIDRNRKPLSISNGHRSLPSASASWCSLANAGTGRSNFLRPATYINQNVSLARRRTIHVQRVTALRDLISVA